MLERTMNICITVNEISFKVDMS